MPIVSKKKINLSTNVSSPENGAKDVRAIKQEFTSIKSAITILNMGVAELIQIMQLTVC